MKIWMHSWCKNTAMLVLIAASTLIAPFSADAYPTVAGLPEIGVTGVQSPVPFTGPVGPTYGTLTVATPATGPISAAGSPPNINPYNIWCWNPYAYVQPNAATYNAYSSYDPAFLALPGTTSTANASPAPAPATAWQEVNWVINHKKGASGTLNPSVMDIQNVIWDVLIPGYYAYLTGDGLTLYNDALANGPGFMPAGGQLLAVALYVGGINSNDGPNNPQDVIAEFLLPSPPPQNPGLSIKKTANVTTAKCTDKVTYTYTVTNTGNVALANVTVVDDNGTPNFAGDDVTIACAATLAPGNSATCSRALNLPLTQYGVDAYGNGANHTLITNTLPNGNIQVTLVEDQNIVDNTYGNGSSPDWGNYGNSLWNHLGQDSAEFQFVDGAGNVVLDFAVDYASLNFSYPSGIGTAGVSGGAGHMFAGNSSNIVSMDTSLTDNMNQNGNAGNWYFNSPPPNYANWNPQCTYTVVIKGSCFGRYGYGGCDVKQIQHNKCKTGNSYQCNPTPVCKTVTNRATATATAVVNGTPETVTSNTASASVQLSPGGTQSCQTPPTCHCTCWNCQHGDHQHCQNTHCTDSACKEQQCQQQQHCAPSSSRPQSWWNQCNQNYQRCGGRPW